MKAIKSLVIIKSLLNPFHSFIFFFILHTVEVFLFQCIFMMNLNCIYASKSHCSYGKEKDALLSMLRGSSMTIESVANIQLQIDAEKPESFSFKLSL